MNIDEASPVFYYADTIDSADSFEANYLHIRLEILKLKLIKYEKLNYLQ